MPTASVVRRKRRPPPWTSFNGPQTQKFGHPRHSIFTKSNPEDAKPTQPELPLCWHIEPICANTPQAKGRVERLFQTLQDRMCKALRLDGVANMDDANAWLGSYLRQHNQRFAVAVMRLSTCIGHGWERQGH
ncbi:MAG: hypothetical protein KIT63_10090 [Rhodoferax sp.]|nr:hypothetical protein [Rhodoferax sp.]